MDNLLLLGIAQIKALKQCGGIMRFLCAVDETVNLEPMGETSATSPLFRLPSVPPTPHARRITCSPFLNRFVVHRAQGLKHADQYCFADEVEEPVLIPIPDSKGGLRYVSLIIYPILWSCDWLAGQSFGPFAESTGAHHWCSKCHVLSTCWCISMPTSLVALTRRPHAEGCKGHQPRTVEELEALMARYRSENATQKKHIGVQHGINCSHYLLDAKHFKGMDPITKIADDAMHIFLCGLSRSNGWWTVHNYIEVEKCTCDFEPARGAVQHTAHHTATHRHAGYSLTRIFG